MRVAVDVPSRDFVRKAGRVLKKSRRTLTVDGEPTTAFREHSGGSASVSGGWQFPLAKRANQGDCERALWPQFCQHTRRMTTCRRQDQKQDRCVIANGGAIVLAGILIALMPARMDAQQHEGTIIAAVTITGLRTIKEEIVREQIESKRASRTGRPWPTRMWFDWIGSGCSATSR